ncbi:MAG: hypothetical protein ABI183_25865 [Polyangiaceae bacterium]
MKRIAPAILGISLVVGAAQNAHAKDPLRIAVATTLHREALGVRLGAEIAELGYAAVPISSDDTHDGAVLASSLQKNDAVAALVLDDEGDGLIACVVERAGMHRTCRQVAARDEPRDDGLIATRSVELLRALLLENEGASGKGAPIQIDSGLKTSTLETPPQNPPAAAPAPHVRKSIVAARLGGGIFATSGTPAEVIAGVGLEWLALTHGALSLDASLPVTGATINRDAGTATVRVSTLTLHADARMHVRRFEGELGAGAGALWLQANGIIAPSAGSPTNQGVDASLFDPFVALHAAGVFFFDRAIALRLDVIGAYGLNRAVIRFVSEDVAEVGRPMLTSTLSLAIAWP